MNSFCNTCILGNNIEKQRISLNNLVVEKKYNLLDGEIISLSQLLDNLVYECVICKKDLNHFSKIDLKNIFGTHSTFYYYGQQHLFTSMYVYINEGIKNNEFIYISMVKSLYEKLISFLKIKGVYVENIKFNPVKELIDFNNLGGSSLLKEKINNILSEEEVKNFSGIRWIGQPTFAIQTTSQKDFLDFEINLSESLENTKASLLCIYDAYDYMHEGEFINEVVIKESLNTHSYVLKNSLLEKIK